MSRTIFRSLPAGTLEWVLVASLFTACVPEKTAEQVELTPYFDLEAFIDTEVDRLEAEYPTADKEITFNEATESHEDMTLDYEDELSIFRNADINRPAWLDKYRIDTLREGEQTIITYLAQDSTLSIRKLTVTQRAAEVVRIEVDSRTGTVLSDGRRYLRYEPATGYLIDSYQDRRIGQSLDTRINVRFPR